MYHRPLKLAAMAVRCRAERFSSAGAILHRRSTPPSTLRFFSSALRFNDDEVAPPILSYLPAAFLRASDPSNFDPATMQRNNVAFDSHTGKPMIAGLSSNNDNNNGVGPNPSLTEIVDWSFRDDNYQVVWKDGLVSNFSAQWVEETWHKREGFADNIDRVLWNGLTEETVRSPSSNLNVAFDTVLTPDGMTAALHTLYQHGILLVTDTPIHDKGAGVSALTSALGGGSMKNSTSLVTHYNKEKHETNQTMLANGTDGPMRTLYGTVWSTSSAGQANGASVADSSYGHEGLPLHNDMTYSRDPPGLQIFTMVQPSRRGGESTYCDGFAAAERLRQSNPRAFNMLTSTVRRYRCMDRDTGWHLEASGPVIALDPSGSGEIVMVRHNDLDRLPDLAPSIYNNDYNKEDEFYHDLQLAHMAWDEILADDKMRLVIGLSPGDTVVLANQVSRFLFVV